MEQMMNAAACLFEKGKEQHIAIECGTRQASYGDLRQAVARGADSNTPPLNEKWPSSPRTEV